MGDDKPTVFLQRIRNLAGGQCNDNVLRSLFMEQLPEHVRGILAISQLDDLATLAAQADRIAEVMHPQVSVMRQTSAGDVALPSGATASGGDNVDALAGPNRDIIELRRAVDALTKRFERAFQGRSRSRDRSSRRVRGRSATPHRSEESRICYYHRRFGNNARNCKQPCTWTADRDQRKEN